MSGIAGILYLDGRPVESEVLNSMTDMVAHRGPDGIGHWIEGPVGLAHLQMHTTPESINERQPLTTYDGRYVVVCDGRLDNREELIEELGSSVHVDRQVTDAELVLQSYSNWGTKCATHIVGDYAFAVWDSLERQLFCARDPIGMRLFHYLFDGRRFIFGTEIKQVLRHPEVPQSLNEMMLGLYLCGNWGDGEMTFYQDICRLKGGYSLTVSRRGLSKQVFWDPNTDDHIRYKNESDYVDHFKTVFSKAVHSRLRSNTPVGIMLSGGLDSGSVASVAGSFRNEHPTHVQDVEAYYWKYRDPPLDETPFVEAVTEKYGIPLTTVSVDDLWAMKPIESAASKDEPFGLHFETLHHRSLGVTSGQGTRVVLTGEGGDEAFMSGYMLYLRDWVFGLRLVTLWRDLRNGTPYYRRNAYRLLRRGLVPPTIARIMGRSRSSIPSWISKEFNRRLGLSEYLDAAQAYRYRDSIYFQSRGVNPLFIGGDQRAATYKTEIRHPFWDSRLVEFLVRIPPTIRIQGGRNKLLLKKAMNGILPDSVLRRSSHGAFASLLSRGYRKNESERLLELTDGSQLEALGAIEGRELRRVYQEYLQGDDAKLGRLFWAFTTEDWLRKEWAPTDKPLRSLPHTAISSD